MPITTLDPRTALLVIDLQKGIVAMTTHHPMAGIVARSVSLIEAFRQRALPVVLVNVDGAPPGRTEASLGLGDLPPDWADLVPELDPQPGDILITKRARGAFAKTALEATLRDLSVTQVVIVGVATGSGVESTARQAFDLGFNVTIAVDAITDRSVEIHEHAVRWIFPRLGETGATVDILALLAV